MAVPFRVLFLFFSWQSIERQTNTLYTFYRTHPLCATLPHSFVFIISLFFLLFLITSRSLHASAFADEAMRPLVSHQLRKDYRKHRENKTRHKDLSNCESSYIPAMTEREKEGKWRYRRKKSATDIAALNTLALTPLSFHFLCEVW